MAVLSNGKTRAPYCAEYGVKNPPPPQKKNQSNEGQLISRNDAADLLWYFSEGTSAFERSPFGGMLERASALMTDSTGKIIPKEDPSEWHVAPVKHQPAEPSYTPEIETMVRVARTSRRLS